MPQNFKAKSGKSGQVGGSARKGNQTKKGLAAKMKADNARTKKKASALIHAQVELEMRRRVQQDGKRLHTKKPEVPAMVGSSRIKFDPKHQNRKAILKAVPKTPKSSS